MKSQSSSLVAAVQVHVNGLYVQLRRNDTGHVCNVSQRLADLGMMNGEIEQLQLDEGFHVEVLHRSTKTGELYRVASEAVEFEIDSGQVKVITVIFADGKWSALAGDDLCS